MKGLIYTSRYFRVIATGLIFLINITSSFAGCADTSIGVENKYIIPDSSFTATSYFDDRFKPYHARLNGNLNGWAPSSPNRDDPNQYLQIYLGRLPYVICAVATQGSSGSREWVTQYKISLSMDNTNWTPYQENGALKIEKMRKELDELKQKAGVTTVDGAITALQALIGRPSALFDPYAVIASLEEVVSRALNFKDKRATRYKTILKKCRPLVAEPCLQSILTKLVANKEEAEVSKAIDKALRRQGPALVPGPAPGFPRPFRNRWLAAGRPAPATGPYRRPRNRGPRKCFVCNSEDHIARYCPNRR